MVREYSLGLKPANPNRPLCSSRTPRRVTRRLRAAGAAGVCSDVASAAPCGGPLGLWSAETLRTLDFANKAKLVKNKPVVLLDPQVSVGRTA